jgi:hypothetical protein
VAGDRPFWRQPRSPDGHRRLSLSDQRHNEEQLQPEDGNEGEDDSCDYHRNPRTGSRETGSPRRESTVSSTVPLSRVFQSEV